MYRKHEAIANYPITAGAFVHFFLFLFDNDYREEAVLLMGVGRYIPSAIIGTHSHRCCHAAPKYTSSAPAAGLVLLFWRLSRFEFCVYSFGNRSETQVVLEKFSARPHNSHPIPSTPCVHQYTTLCALRPCVARETKKSQTEVVYDLGFSFFSFHNAIRPTPETLTTLKRTPGISPFALPLRPKPARRTSSFSSTKFRQPSLGTEEG